MSVSNVQIELAGQFLLSDQTTPTHLNIKIQKSSRYRHFYHSSSTCVLSCIRLTLCRRFPSPTLRRAIKLEIGVGQNLGVSARLVSLRVCGWCGRGFPTRSWAAGVWKVGVGGAQGVGRREEGRIWRCLMVVMVRGEVEFEDSSEQERARIPCAFQSRLYRNPSQTPLAPLQQRLSLYPTNHNLSLSIPFQYAVSAPFRTV